MENDKIYINPEKLHKIMLKMILNNKQEVVCWAIKGLLDDGFTWTKISEKFDGIGRGQLFRIHKGEYWPKSKEKQQDLFIKAVELI